MKIAFFSDVHANLPALEAVLQDIKKQKVDMIFCLGDLVSYGPWPNEVIELIRERNITCIAGNHDEIIGSKTYNSTIPYAPDTSKSIGEQSIYFTNSLVTEENRDYLNNLPRHIRLTFSLGSKNLNILLVHGSPERIDEYLTEDLPDDKFQEIFERNRVDILLFGHTHKPFHKIIPLLKPNESNTYHAINLGSVGKPKDGNPKACYVLLFLNSNTSETNVKVEFVRVEYDIEKTSKAIEKSALPSEFANMLRKAF
jgi:putative phosphoesterase